MSYVPEPTMCDDGGHLQFIERADPNRRTTQPMIGPADAATTPKELSIDEINAAIPRSVYLSGEGQTPVQVCVGIVLLGLIWTAAISYAVFNDQHKADALRREGRQAAGSVTKIYHGRRSGDTVYYRFPVGGTVYRGQATVSDFQSLRVAVGDQLPIEFLPLDPTVNHPSGWDWWGFGEVIAFAMGLMFLGSGVWGLVFAYQRRRLARMGWVTEGRVIACAPKGDRFRVDYVFCTEDKTEFDGANEYSYDEYQYGSKIRVIYLRGNPKRNDTYPVADFPTVGD